MTRACQGFIAALTLVVVGCSPTPVTKETQATDGVQAPPAPCWTLRRFCVSSRIAERFRQ
jgi:hypothetical protein